MQSPRKISYLMSVSVQFGVCFASVAVALKPYMKLTLDDYMDYGNTSSVLDVGCVKFAYNTEETDCLPDHGDCTIASHCMESASGSEPSAADNEERMPNSLDDEFDWVTTF